MKKRMAFVASSSLEALLRGWCRWLCQTILFLPTVLAISSSCCLCVLVVLLPPAWLLPCLLNIPPVLCLFPMFPMCAGCLFVSWLLPKPTLHTINARYLLSILQVCCLFVMSTINFFSNLFLNRENNIFPHKLPAITPLVHYCGTRFRYNDYEKFSDEHRR